MAQLRDDVSGRGHAGFLGLPGGFGFDLLGGAFDFDSGFHDDYTLA